MSSWFMEPARASNPRMRLFAVPHAGRGASLFFPWRRLLPDWLELVAVQLPGRESRITEPLLPAIDMIVEALAAEIRPRLDLPYALFGHSMGALICFELARALRRAGAPPPAAVILSGRRPPMIPDPHPPLHTLSDDRFIEEVRTRYDGIPRLLMEEPEFRRILLPILRADIAAIANHVCCVEAPLAVPLILYTGQNDPHASPAVMAGWSALSTRAERVKAFPGGHFYLEAEREALVAALVSDLARQPGTGLDGGARAPPA